MEGLALFDVGSNFWGTGHETPHLWGKPIREKEPTERSIGSLRERITGLVSKPTKPTRSVPPRWGFQRLSCFFIQKIESLQQTLKKKKKAYGLVLIGNNHLSKCQHVEGRWKHQSSIILALDHLARRPPGYKHLTRRPPGLYSNVTKYSPFNISHLGMFCCCCYSYVSRESSPTWNFSHVLTELTKRYAPPALFPLYWKKKKTQTQPSFLYFYH